MTTTQKEKKKCIQVELMWSLNSTEANLQLRGFQETYPNRRIISVSMVPNDMGWFTTVAYEVEV